MSSVFSSAVLPYSRFLTLPALLALAACGGTSTAGAPLGDDGGSDAATSGDDDGATGSDGGADSQAPDSATTVPTAPAPFATVPLSSCVPTVYTTPVAIGGSQSFQLLIDTGSTTLGVAAAACTNCDVSPEYTPGASAVDENKTASSQFGSGSWSGEIYQDTVAAGTAPSTPVKFVAIDSQMQFFEPIQCDSTTGSGVQGVLGLGPDLVALAGTNGYINALVTNESMPNLFATELCDSSGSLWLGSYDSTHATGAPQFVPISSGEIGEAYYAVGLTSVTIDGTTVAIASASYPDTFVDTGTSVFFLPQAAYNTIETTLDANPAFVQAFGGTSFFTSQDCTTTTMTKAELDANLPAMTLTFGSTTVATNPTDSYLVDYGGGRWCPALDAFEQSAELPIASILGAPMLRSNITIFDRANRQIGFVPHTSCQ